MERTEYPPLVRQCIVCHKRSNLLRCAGCKVVYYCSKAHQAAHFKSHKWICKEIRLSRRAYLNEETLLRNAHPPIPWPEKGTGFFWRYYFTRPYVETRFSYACFLLCTHSVDAVETALNHLTDLLRLCGTDDELRIRDVIPALLLRLDRDQECYDLVRDYYRVVDVGMVPVERRVDALESVTLFYHPINRMLENLVPATLIKARMLVELEDLRNSEVLFRENRMPAELCNMVRSHLVGSALAQRPDIIRSRNDDYWYDRVRDQLYELFDQVDCLNPYFWPALFDLTLLPPAPPGFPTHHFGLETLGEAARHVYFNYASWMQSPRAMAAIKRIPSAHIVEAHEPYLPFITPRGILYSPYPD